MARRKVPSATKGVESPGQPTSGQDDPLLIAMDEYVLATLRDPKSSARVLATAAQIGLKLLQVKHSIIGESDEGDFFK